MKGVVFTEFLELVESRFSPEMADDILESCNLESGGSYTSVGTYDYRELIALVADLSTRSKVPAQELIRSFGKHLATRFASKYPAFFRADGFFEFLEGVDNYIHVEVRKLYPDAELPRFTTNRISDESLEMIYASARPFDDLALGLIEGTAELFGEVIEIERQPTELGIRFLLRQLCKEPV